MSDLSLRQKAVLDAVVEHFEANGFSPSFRELAVACGLASTNTVQEHLYRLCAKGYIAIVPNSQRAIRIIRRSDGVRVRVALLPMTIARSDSQVEWAPV